MKRIANYGQVPVKFPADAQREVGAPQLDGGISMLVSDAVAGAMKRAYPSQVKVLDVTDDELLRVVGAKYFQGKMPPRKP